MNTLFTVEKLSEVKALLRSAKEDNYENTIFHFSNEEKTIIGRVTVIVTNRGGVKRELRLHLFYNEELLCDCYISVMNCKDLKDLEKEILSTIQKVLINGK